MAKDTKPEPTTEDAKKLLLADQEKRKAACGTDLEALMKQHNCTLDVVMVLRSGTHPQAQISIIPL